MLCVLFTTRTVWTSDRYSRTQETEEQVLLLGRASFEHIVSVSLLADFAFPENSCSRNKKLVLVVCNSLPLVPEAQSAAFELRVPVSWVWDGRLDFLLDCPSEIIRRLTPLLRLLQFPWLYHTRCSHV